MEKLTDFKFLEKNPNKHTARGMGMLDKSISKYGYITPMTSAADGTILDGNARLEQVGQLLPADPIVIHHDGTRPIIAVRDDIPDGKGKMAREIAIAANRVGQVDLEWSPEVIAEAQCDGVAVMEFFREKELDKLFPTKKEIEDVFQENGEKLQKFLDARKKSKERGKDKAEVNFWACLVFQSWQQKQEFLSAISDIPSLYGMYINGETFADKFCIPITKNEEKPFKNIVDKKLEELTDNEMPDDQETMG